MKPPSVNLKSRMMVLFVIIFIVFFALIIRVAYWQIVRGEELKTKAVQQQTRERTVTANRGYIYDRNDKALAKSVTVDTLVCSPAQVKADGYPEVVARSLSEILQMDYDNIYNIITKNSSYQTIKKRLSAEESRAVKALKDSSGDKEKEAQGRKNELSKVYSGIYFEEDSKRYYSYNIAPHVIGFTGYDNDGRQGIEMTFDDALTGKAGNVVSAKAANGVNMDFQYEAQVEAEKGCDVVLTIDETIQHFLEKHLENAVIESQLKEGTAGIIMNPKTGEILAMSTKPDFNLNDPNNTEIFERYQINVVNDEISDNPEATPESEKDKITRLRYKMWRNKAISDTYEPGSTFKIITAAIGLEENVVNLDSQFYCSGSVQVGPHNIGCHKKAGHGAENFVQGVQNSCNPVFIETGLRIGGEKFMDYFRAFGLTEKTGIELIGEAGSIYHTGKLNEADIATSAFGQGFNITPIQLITAVSAVINGGNLMKPMLVKEIRNETGIVQSYQPEIKNKVISQETSDTMRTILESVVSSPNGSGKNAYIKGYRIGGKTGTSEKGARNDANKPRIASFIGFAPADDPQVVCLVMLDEPQCDVKYGGTIAAPLVGSILEDVLEYMGVERVFTEEELEEMKLAVPELRGLSADEAKNEAGRSGLKIKVSGEGETVVDQLPKPGASITNGSTVIIYMEEHEGGSLVEVPNVVGLSMEEAKARLENAGLNFEIVGAGQKTSQGAYAAKQSVKAGESVIAATVIGVEFRHEASD